MPISNVTFLRSTVALLLLGLATLLVIVGITMWLTVRTDAYSREVTQGRVIRSTLVALRSQVQDAETGQRGYLLASEDAYLQPYEDARLRIDGSLARLSDQFRARPEAPSVDRLGSVVRVKMAELAETIRLARAGRVDQAIALVKTDQGKRAMDEIRHVIATLLADVDARIVNRMDAQIETIGTLEWAILVGGVLIILVVGGSAVIAWRYTRELIAARIEVMDLASGLERRVADRTAALARANDEIQRFAYVVSHDLRSPLVNVIGFTNELDDLRRQVGHELETRRSPANAASAERDTELDRDFAEALGFITTSVTKMDGLITAILKLAREGGRAMAPERIDLADLLQKAADNVRHRVSDLGGEVVIAGDLPTIVSDRLSVEQVFGNLLDNAVKYAAKGRAPIIRVTGSSLLDGIAIAVADNGHGIAPADRTRVFELFRRAGPRDVAGEGIGLAHVQTMLRRLGGEISLESEFGQGTTFTVTLPRELRRDLPAAA